MFGIPDKAVNDFRPSIEEMETAWLLASSAQEGRSSSKGTVVRMNRDGFYMDFGSSEIMYRDDLEGISVSEIVNVIALSGIILGKSGRRDEWMSFAASVLRWTESTAEARAILDLFLKFDSMRYIVFDRQELFSKYSYLFEPYQFDEKNTFQNFVVNSKKKTLPKIDDGALFVAHRTNGPAGSIKEYARIEVHRAHTDRSELVLRQAYARVSKTQIVVGGDYPSRARFEGLGAFCEFDIVRNEPVDIMLLGTSHKQRLSEWQEYDQKLRELSGPSYFETLAAMMPLVCAGVVASSEEEWIEFVKWMMAKEQEDLHLADSPRIFVLPSQIETGLRVLAASDSLAIRVVHAGYLFDYFHDCFPRFGFDKPWTDILVKLGVISAD